MAHGFASRFGFSIDDVLPTGCQSGEIANSPMKFDFVSDILKTRSSQVDGSKFGGTVVIVQGCIRDCIFF
jgi:hypothetical protein